jgi:hypothetical protein
MRLSDKYINENSTYNILGITELRCASSITEKKEEEPQKLKRRDGVLSVVNTLDVLLTTDRRDSICPRGDAHAEVHKSETCAIVVNVFSDKLMVIAFLKSRTEPLATLRRHHSATGIYP